LRAPVDPEPSTLTASKYDDEWGFPYTDWQQELKTNTHITRRKPKRLLAEAGYPHGFKTTWWFEPTPIWGLLEIVKSYFAPSDHREMEVRVMSIPDGGKICRNPITNTSDSVAIPAVRAVRHTYAPHAAITGSRRAIPPTTLWSPTRVLNAFYPKALWPRKTRRNSRHSVAAPPTSASPQHYAVSLLLPCNIHSASRG